ncbi:hypothetical protein RRG08_029189 [Elysia crispata]|uniref:Uncharacterized protein n=1 Tax=Elysia crispata TaxID=231223 RepID=A0AAE1AJ30_9GAST|nr:hypothetical protein RRG08_029189 [Elysia crispata]
MSAKTHAKNGLKWNLQTAALCLCVQQDCPGGDDLSLHTEPAVCCLLQASICLGSFPRPGLAKVPSVHTFSSRPSYIMVSHDF